MQYLLSSVTTGIDQLLRIEFQLINMVFLILINPPVDANHPPRGSSSFSREWRELLFQVNFIAVSSTLEVWSKKNFFRLEIPSWL